jgi:hypothetical protein
MARIKGFMQEAHDTTGVSKKVLNVVVKEQTKLLSIKKDREKLEEGERAERESIADALGDFADTELGLAVLKE